MKNTVLANIIYNIINNINLEDFIMALPTATPTSPSITASLNANLNNLQTLSTELTKRKKQLENAESERDSKQEEMAIKSATEYAALSESMQTTATQMAALMEEIKNQQNSLDPKDPLRNAVTEQLQTADKALKQVPTASNVSHQAKIESNTEMNKGDIRSTTREETLADGRQRIVTKLECHPEDRKQLGQAMKEMHDKYGIKMDPSGECHGVKNRAQWDNMNKEIESRFKQLCEEKYSSQNKQTGPEREAKASEEQQTGKMQMQPTKF